MRRRRLGGPHDSGGDDVELRDLARSEGVGLWVTNDRQSGTEARDEDTEEET